jgi:cytochrome P450
MNIVAADSVLRSPPILLRAALVALLLLPLIPLARCLIHPSLWRRYRAFPPLQATVIAGILAIAAAAMLAAIAFPILLWPAAGAAVAWLIWERAQSAASWGKSDGLPAGSLAYFPLEPWRDPGYFAKQAAIHGRVFKFRQVITPAIAITGLPAIADFLRANETKLEVPPAPFNAIIPGGFIRYATGDDHNQLTSTFRSAFSGSVIEHHGDLIASEAQRALEQIRSGAMIRDAIDTMMVNSLFAVFLGVDERDRDWFRTQYHVANYRRLARTGKTRARKAVIGIIERLRTMPRDNAAPSFLSELIAQSPAHLNDDWILANLVYMLHLARFDVGGLLAWLLAMTGRHPGSLEHVRRELRETGSGALKPNGAADRIVRETLRLHQSEFLIRRTKSPIEWNGFRIPAGWHIRMCIAESHRTGDSFERPDEFHPERFSTTPQRGHYTPFGFAPHLCLGEHLARAIGRHLVCEIARRYAIDAADVEPLEFNGFHWTPGSRMTLKLRVI